jgi:integrase
LRTGLRLGDLLSLEWRHWDPVLRRIRVPASEVPTGRAIDVPLAKDAAQELDAIQAMSSRSVVVPRNILGALGLPVSEGQPDEQAALLAFAKARRRAGIREGDFFSLRLTYLRNCAMAGVSMAFAVRACDWDGDWSTAVELYERHSPREALHSKPWTTTVVSHEPAQACP